jgi:hypothetical protein
VQPPLVSLQHVASAGQLDAPHVVPVPAVEPVAHEPEKSCEQTPVVLLQQTPIAGQLEGVQLVPDAAVVPVGQVPETMAVQAPEVLLQQVPIGTSCCASSVIAWEVVPPQD